MMRHICSKNREFDVVTDFGRKDATSLRARRTHVVSQATHLKRVPLSKPGWSSGKSAPQTQVSGSSIAVESRTLRAAASTEEAR